MSTTSRLHRQGVAVFCMAVLICVATGVWAQSADGESYDLGFEIINGTTGQPGTLDRLEIHHLSVVGRKILDTQPDGAQFTLEDVHLRERAAYLVTAWKNSVPYFWQFKGRNLGEETTRLHVFDTSADLTGARIKGLTLVVRQQGSIVALEYNLNIANTAVPQVTLVGNPASVTLQLPAGADDLEAEYMRGPNPTPIAIKSLGADRYGLDVPLTSGNNQITMTALAPWSEAFVLPISAGLPVDAWSLLVSPENLIVRSNDLEPDNSNSFSGHQRLVGEPLESGQKLDIRITKPLGAGQTENLFTQAPETAQTPPDSLEALEGASQSGPPVGLTIVGAILLAGIIIVVLRRRSNS